MTAIAFSRGLWLGVAAAPLAWVVQGLAGWFFGAHICGDLSVSTVRWITALIGVLALIVAVRGIAIGRIRWRSAQAAAAAPETAGEFLTFAGVFVSATLTVGIAWATLNAILIDGCGAMR